MPGVPFDNTRHIVPSRGGRVTNVDGSEAKGLYVSGWLKRGPSGIIATNVIDAKETVAAIIDDVRANKLPPATV